MREIEIKARVEDAKNVLASLSENGVLVGEPVTQHDVVYARPGARDNDPKENWLRIRTEGGIRSIFTLKRSISADQLDSIEHETEVSDPDELAKIIDYLGYQLYSDLTKTRQKVRVGDVEVCFDKVESLGVFIEVEKLTDDTADAKAVKKELWDMLKQFGISERDEVTDGYDVLMRTKYGPPKPVEKAIHTILVYYVQNNQVLLALKKSGFDEGKINGIGGKVNVSESADDAVVRISKEEITVTPTYFSKVGELEFLLWHKAEQQKNFVEVYLCEEWKGTPSESNEVAPKWVSCDDLPFADMWPTDQFWLPQVIAGERVKGVFEYDKNNQPVKHSVTFIEAF